MHRFSIIVPKLGDDRLFDDTLASVLRYRPDSAQILVMHDGSYEDPYHLQNEVEFIVSDCRDLLAESLNFAATQAEGELIALVRPGIELDENWHVPVESAFADERIGSVSPIIVAPRSPNNIISAGVTRGFGFRRNHVGVGKKVASRKLRKLRPQGPTSWAAFYRQSSLAQIGEFCADRTESIYLDLDIALSLKRLGYENAMAADCHVQVERSLIISQESKRSHGVSAQRASRRHSDPAGTSWLATIGVFTAEVLASPFQPWLVQHAFQRLGALKRSRFDREFSQRLGDVAQKKWLHDELASFPLDASAATRSDAHAGRRAA